MECCLRFDVKNSLLKYVQAFCIHSLLLHFLVVLRAYTIHELKWFLYLSLGDFLYVLFQEAQIPVARSLGRINVVMRSQYLCVPSMYLSLCHPSGGRNFDVAATFLKWFCSLVLRNNSKFICLKIYLNSDWHKSIFLQNYLFIRLFIYLLDVVGR